VSLISELLESDELGFQIDHLTAIPSTGGRFEITVNDQLIYSKLALGRHAEAGEIQSLIKNLLNNQPT